MDESALMMIVTFAAVAAVLTPPWVWWQRRASQKRREMLTAMIPSYGGEVVGSSFWTEPMLHFSLGGMPARVWVWTGKRPNAELTVELNRAGLNLFDVVVVTDKLDQKIGKLMGMQDLEIGDAQFDRKMVLRASDPERLRAFLQPQTRRAILTLVQLSSWGHMRIAVTGQRFVVEGLGEFDAPLLREFLFHCDRVFADYVAACL
jgi:hypothetical protein